MSLYNFFPKIILLCLWLVPTHHNEASILQALVQVHFHKHEYLQAQIISQFYQKKNKAYHGRTCRQSPELCGIVASLVLRLRAFWYRTNSYYASCKGGQRSSVQLLIMQSKLYEIVIKLTCVYIETAQ